MCQCRKRPPRRRPPKASLVLIKEDLDAFQLALRAMDQTISAVRAEHPGVEIQQGDRGSFYLPRIRAVL